MTGRVRSLDDFSGPLMERLRRAADDLRLNPGTTLRIPPGDYVVDTPLSRQLRQALFSGGLGDDPEKVLFTPYHPYSTALDLQEVRDCTVDAAGARFLLGGPMQAVELDHCSAVTLRGLAVDCVPKPFTQAVVTGQGPGFVDLRLPDGCGVTERTPAPRIVPLSPEGGFAPGCMESFSRTRVGEGTYRFFGMPDLPDWVGRRAVLIHTYHYRPAIYLAHCEDVTLEGGAVHAQYGMGLLAYRCRDLTLRGFAVTPSAGACISVNTDATHFAACSGTIRLEDCALAGSEDDGVNVHSYYYDPEPLGDRICLLRVKSPTFPHPQVIDSPRPGEELTLYDRDTLAERGRFLVREAEEDRAELAARVVLDRPLTEYGLLLNTSLKPHLEVVRCRFEHILTRCLLIKAETALVKDCVFRDCPGTAVHIAPEVSWREGGAVRRAVLEDDLFDHVGYGTYGIHGGASVLCVEGGCPYPVPDLHGEVRFVRSQVMRPAPGRPERCCSALGRFVEDAP